MWKKHFLVIIKIAWMVDALDAVLLPFIALLFKGYVIGVITLIERFWKQ